jgi:two-component system OmpR family response regulator
MRTSSLEAPVGDETVVTVGPLSIDLQGYAVAVDDTDIVLTVSEFLLLKTLVQQRHRVVDRTCLWSKVQGDGTCVEVDERSLRSVDRHVARLRKKLRAAGYDGIQTMRHVGYRLRR